jgi:hypothetical protein
LASKPGTWKSLATEFTEVLEASAWLVVGI